MGSASNNTNESTSGDVSKLVSMGFDRARAIQALNEHGGSLDGAIASLTGGGGGGGSWSDADVNVWGPSRSEADTATDSPLKLIDNDDHDDNNTISFPTTTATSMEGKVWEHAAVKSSSYLLPNAADAPSSSLSPQATAAARRVEQIEDNEGPEPPVSMLPDENQNNSKKLSALTTKRMELIEDNGGPQPPTEMIIAGFHDDEGAKNIRNDNSKIRSALLISDQRQGAAAISMETAADGVVSFDSTE
jgi:hypothetical protein